MKRSLEEKLAYNRKQKTDFSTGYVFGVNIYQAYATASVKDKAVIKQMISLSSVNARNGYKMDKGVMCGVRDAANERKERKGK